MARSTTGKSRFKIQRSLGVELPGLGKAGALERRPYGPGQHGNKRKKISDYAVRLKEKQKLRYHYGLREGQLVNYVKKAKKNKSRAWMETLLITLESRLANVVFRLNWAPSMLAAYQLVSHGHILVNGKKVNVAGQILDKGDVVTITDKGAASLNYMQAQATPRLPSIPACFTVEGKTAKVVDLPLPADIPFEYEGQLVTEFYWKIK